MTTAVQRAYHLLSSWKLSVALTLAGALYFVFLSIWGARSPAHVVQSIAGLLPFTLFYSLLVINTTLCIISRLRGLVALSRKTPVFLPLARDWEIDALRVPVFRGNAERVGHGYFWVYRRYSSVGTLLLHGSLLLIAAGFLLSHRTHVEGAFTMGLHEKSRIGPSAYREITPRGADAGRLPELQVVVDEIDTEFWRDELLFTRFTADLSVDGRATSVAINDPAWLSPFSFLRLTSFGYSPVYMVIAEGEQTPLEEGSAILRVFPPGTRGLLRLRSLPHRFYIRLFPDYEETETGPRSKSMRLDNPRVDVEIYRGKVFVARRMLRFGESLDVEGFSFSILGVLPNAQMTVVRDLGLPFILLGFVLMLVGLLLRIRGRRQEILAVEQPDGGWKVMGKNIEEPAA